MELRLSFGSDLVTRKYMRALSWEDFFARFDLMGLTFVYDNNPSLKPTESYQILQEESRSPYQFTEKRA